MKWHAGEDEEGRRRVEAVVETLAAQRRPGESLKELVHDARNMVTALSLYCDLLREPGVLNPAFLHYGNELSLLVATSRRLVDGLTSMAGRSPAGNRAPLPEEPRLPFPDAHLAVSTPAVPSPGEHWPGDPISNLSRELEGNCRLLRAMAGSSISVKMTTDGGAVAVNLRGEDLTRILVNLLRNACDAMPGGGCIGIRLTELPAASAASSLLLTFEDTGFGIAEDKFEAIFEAGFTTKPSTVAASVNPLSNRNKVHRGLGLAITRSILEAAGGAIRASNGQDKGARFEIELPVLHPPVLESNLAESPTTDTFSTSKLS